MINPIITELLTEGKVRQADGICYLLSLYYGYKPTYVPDEIKQKVHSLGIVELDTTFGVDVSSKETPLKWNIPLFEGAETKFSWVVTEYLALFKPFGKDDTYKRECTKRMKSLFAKNPEIRKEDVLRGTSMYIKECLKRNLVPRLVKSPHYFIKKGTGNDATQDILTWVDKYKKVQAEIGSTERATSLSSIMQ